MDVTLTFNGHDFAPALSDYKVSYEPNFRKVVTALNGTEYFGNATRRPIITFSLRSMTDAQTRAAYDALKIMAASCAYTDPATNASRTAQFSVKSNLESVFLLRAADGKRYYEGGTVTLRGVTCLA